MQKMEYEFNSVYEKLEKDFFLIVFMKNWKKASLK